MDHDTSDHDTVMKDSAASSSDTALTRASSFGEDVPVIPEGDPTINWDFLSYEALVRKFFVAPDAFTRLKKFADMEHEDIFSAVVYFVKTYQKGKIVRGDGGGLYCIPDEYRNQITSHKKRYYDFKSKVGKGEPVHKNKANPVVVLQNGSDTVALALPCLVAMWWFISFNFDRVFWDVFEDVMEKYKAYALNNKRTYSNTHKRGRNQIRNEVIERVIQQRSEQPGTSLVNKRKKGNGKTPYLTQEERRLVSTLVNNERVARKEIQRQQKKSRPKKNPIKESRPLIVKGVGHIPEQT